MNMDGCKTAIRARTALLNPDILQGRGCEEGNGLKISRKTPVNLPGGTVPGINVLTCGYMSCGCAYSTEL